MNLNHKRLLTILLALVLMMPRIAHAQSITIGNVTAQDATYNVPFNNYYTYSFVEQIYTATEIQEAGGGSGTITSISFYRKLNNYDMNPTQALSHNIVLYMKNVDQATFPDNMNYVQVTPDDIVYEGIFKIPTTEDWITITLDTPFNYDVTENLLVAVDENTNNYNTRYFSCTTTPNTVHCFYADNYNPNPYDLSSFINGNQAFFNGRHNDVIPFRANIKLDLIPSGDTLCMKPDTFVCIDTTDNSATLAWTGDSERYNVEYKRVSDPFWTTAFTNTESLTTTLTNLDENTYYKAKIQSVCEGNVFSSWRVVEFQTKCSSVASFPWTEDFEGLFEGEIPGCWDNKRGTTVQIATNQQPTKYYWCFTNGQQGNGNSNGTGHNGSKCVRFDSFYNPLGKTNFLKTPTFDFPESTLMLLNFWYRNPSGGDLSVYLSTDGGETYIDTLATNLTDQPEWTEMQIELNDYVGAQDVVITFVGTSNYGDRYAFIYLDDITIKGFTRTKDIVHYTEGENDHYHLIASPIQSISPHQVPGLLDNKFDLYYFDPTQPIEWINYWSSDFDLIPGKGYLYANNRDVTITFTGMPYDGDGTIVLARSNEYKFPGVNFVGNPFPDTAYIDRNFYVMNADGTDFEVANRNYVLAMEGIIVIATEDGEELTFHREAPAKNAMLTLNLSGPTFSDRAMVRFDENGMLPKLQIDNNSTKLYITQNSTDYAVVRSEGKGELPVSFKAESDGIYTFSFSSEGVNFAYLHLIDHMTGAEVDLLAGDSASATYSFESQAGNFAKRFTIIYETK